MRLPALLVACALTVPLGAVAAPAFADDTPFVIASPTLNVRVATDFPRVIDYTDRGSGAVLHGQDTALHTVTLNGKPYEATGTARQDGAAVRYTLTFTELPGVSLEASLAVDGQTVLFAVDKVVESEAFKVASIAIPQHSLLSVRGDQPGAHVATAKIDPSKNRNGDTHLDVTNDVAADSPTGYGYAIVNTGELAAAIETNSVYDSASNDNNRVWRQAVKRGEVTEVGVWSGEWTHRAAGSTTTEELPWAKVVVTGDRNADAAVNWQDGAIAFRDIMTSPLGAKDTADRVITHIPYNFASGGNNPFLKTLDNVKRISLATDGLGQLAILKGYQSEGHDSSHPDYAGHYNPRAGGLTDLNRLLKAGKEWGAAFGVHVNATEAYADAKTFTDAMVDPKAKGWDWLGQSYYMDQRRDLNSGDIAQRFKQLREETDANLKFLYLDVYYSHGWKSERLQRELRKLGWQVGSEWADKLERSNLWSHWANEPTYGGDDLRGINSQIIRFARNGERDVWIDNPLLGSSNIKEFEGWTGQNDWNRFYTNVFQRNLPTKFLQKQQILSWAANEIKLTGDVRVTNASGVREIFAGQGRVLNGEAYLLPWQGKAYHWNPAGGQTTWPVPANLAGQKLSLFKLTDQGRSKIGTVHAVNGQVTLDAQPGVAYVLDVDKGKRKPGFGEFAHVKDPGFNSGTLEAWDVTGTAAVERNALGQYETVVPAGGESTLATDVNDLEPGKRYAASVWVEVEPGKTRKVTLSAGDAVNHLDRSGVFSQLAADEKKGTYFQRLTVRFTASGNSAKLKLVADAGEAVARFDDVRVVETSKTEKDGALAYADFEDAEQGWGPFIKGDSGGQGADPRSVRSERHAPYTQAGWNGKVIDDVLDGDWSMKSHEERRGLVYRTLPQTVRFEPGHRYRVSFDYQSGYGGHYAWVTGYDRGSQNVEVEQAPIGQQRTTATMTREFVAGDCGDYFVGLRKLTDEGAQDQADFVLDNLTVTDLGASTEQAACATLSMRGPKLLPGYANKVEMTFANAETVTATNVTTDLTVPTGWTAAPVGSASIASVSPGASASVVWLVTPPESTEVGTYPLDARASYTAGAKQATVTAALQVATNPPGYVPQDQIKVAAVDSQEGYNGEGDGSGAAAIDGNPGTVWHTAWSAVDPDTPYPHYITLDLGADYDVKELRVLPRQAGNNGMVKGYEVHVSSDGATFTKVTSGSFDATKNEQVIALGPVKAKYVKLVATSSLYAGHPWAAISELNVLGKPAS